MKQDQSEIILTNSQPLLNYLSISPEQISTFLWDIESNLYRTSSTLSKEFIINHKALNHKTYHFEFLGKTKDLQSTWPLRMKIDIMDISKYLDQSQHHSKALTHG
ncbi:hypothetical protein QL285_087147 [Trifolium repens]|nr:hypothetical protein QL285_087147 [Trifolium repens]